MSRAKIIAVANNDYVHIAWSYDKPLHGCAGFSLHRISKEDPAHSEPMPMFSRTVRGARRPATSDELLIRKFSWRDVSAVRDKTYKYRVIPMRAPNLPMPNVAPLETRDWVTVTEQCGDSARVFFNRGILATQATADRLLKARSKKQFSDAAKGLKAQIENVNGVLRRKLSGELLRALTTLLDRANAEGGSCWASLYELTDPELILRLCQQDQLHLILANNNDEQTRNGRRVSVYDGKNRGAALEIQRAIDNGRKIQLLRRYMPAQHIGHNKFLVYCDHVGDPRAVLTGSTNWTPSGLCTQSNNAIILESRKLAGQFLEYWQDLAADAQAAGIPRRCAPMKIPGVDLRLKCANSRPIVRFEGASTIHVWFSPNTEKSIRSGRAAQPQQAPTDMAEVYEILRQAKQSVLFLAFMPGKAGSPGSFHFLKELAKIIAQKPALFVRGAVSDPALARELDRSRWNTPFNDNLLVVSPECIWKDFDDWKEEIYKYGHAVIHDKTIVVDPFGRDCAVITGSHNLGFRASSNNDENMLIIRRNPAIAQAYAAHVMDLMEHYRSRWFAANKARMEARRGTPSGAEVSRALAIEHWSPAFDRSRDDAWQQRYFDTWRPSYAERLFWVSGGAPIPQLTAVPTDASKPKGRRPARLVQNARARRHLPTVAGTSVPVPAQRQGARRAIALVRQPAHPKGKTKKAKHTKKSSQATLKPPKTTTRIRTKDRRPGGR